MALIRDIEGRLAAAGVSVARICRAAGQDRTNWQRWKGGRVPRGNSWVAIRAELVKVIGDVPETFPAPPAPVAHPAEVV